MTHDAEPDNEISGALETVQDLPDRIEAILNGYRRADAKLLDALMEHEGDALKLFKNEHERVVLLQHTLLEVLEGIGIMQRRLEKLVEAQGKNQRKN